MRILLAFCLLCLLHTLAFAELNQDLARAQFEEASEAYNAGNYAEAIALWQELVDQGLRNVELEFNLGNGWYRQAELGEAILHWERALLIAPLDREVQANLDLARDNLVDELPATVRLPLWDWLDRAFLLLPGNLPWWALTLGLALVALVLIRRPWLPGGRANSFQRILLPSGLTLVLVAGLFLFLRADFAGHRNRGVILVDKVVVQAAPSEGATSLFDLHEGTLVTLGRSTEAEDWQQIRLPDGREGWCPAEALEAVEP